MKSTTYVREVSNLRVIDLALGRERFALEIFTLVKSDLCVDMSRKHGRDWGQSASKNWFHGDVLCGSKDED